MLDLLSMSAGSVWPALGSEPRYASEPHPQAVEKSGKEKDQSFKGQESTVGEAL